MTADRTDELVRGMLERRASREPPADLAERTLDAVRAAGRPSDAGARSAPVLRARLSWSAITIVGGLVVIAVMAGLAIGRGPGPAPSQPAAIIGPTATPVSSEPASSVPPPSGAVPSTLPPSATPPADPSALVPGTIAEVTDEGFDLRVRTAPGIGSGSKQLSPLLDTGQRMLVLGGPVFANTYDWYEVLTYGDVELYGWVASGKDGETWIERVDPGCAGEPSAEDVVRLPPEEFLACFGSRAVAVDARYLSLVSPAEACAAAFDVAECALGAEWLQFPTLGVSVRAPSGDSRDLALADLDVPIGVPWAGTMRVTIALDAPDAAGCWVTDAATGAELMPAGRAVAECRVTYVLRDAG